MSILHKAFQENKKREHFLTCSIKLLLNSYQHQTNKLHEERTKGNIPYEFRFKYPP